MGENRGLIGDFNWSTGNFFDFLFFFFSSLLLFTSSSQGIGWCVYGRGGRDGDRETFFEKRDLSADAHLGSHLPFSSACFNHGCCQS